MVGNGRLARRDPRRPRLLLVESDLGRRATLAVAVGTRYAVEVATDAPGALMRAAATSFDLAVLDAGALGAELPAVIRALRRGRRALPIVVIAERRDFRAHHFAALFQ